MLFRSAAEAGFLGSGSVSPNSGISATATRFSGFNVFIGGLAVTYGGLTIGGHTQVGTINGQYGLAPAAAPLSVAALVGASYTIGPVIAGVQAYQYDNAGASHQSGLGPQNRLVGELRERGIAAGGTYTVVPGLSIFLDYLWGERKENGWDLLNGASTVAANGTNNGVNNKTRVQGIGLGTQLRW